MNAIDAINIAYGRTIRTLTPCGRIFLLREQNGQDDDVLSNPGTQRDLTNIDNFLFGIVLKEIIEDQEVPVYIETIMTLPQNTRYHLLIFSRIHSLGPVMKFSFDWGDDNQSGGKFEYEENLSQYLHDYTQAFPEEGEPGYFKYRIPPYEQGTNHTKRYDFTTSSNKVVRFGVMTRQGEKQMLKLKPEEMTKNAELKNRFIQYYNEAKEWVTIENFKMFSKMDMVEIHRAVLDIDPTYQFISEIEHPRTKETFNHPIMHGPDFFFPREV